ncbi:Uncharacterised protein [Nocardiopsis dassonvillei]|nr:Uncharacterised protein [Nocardiopsis dassonvillei]
MASSGREPPALRPAHGTAPAVCRASRRPPGPRGQRAGMSSGSRVVKSSRVAFWTPLTRRPA